LHRTLDRIQYYSARKFYKGDLSVAEGLRNAQSIETFSTAAQQHEIALKRLIGVQ